MIYYKNVIFSTNWREEMAAAVLLSFLWIYMLINNVLTKKGKSFVFLKEYENDKQQVIN